MHCGLRTCLPALFVQFVCIRNLPLHLRGFFYTIETVSDKGSLCIGEGAYI